MHTLTGVLNDKQAREHHDTSLALEVYACLRDYCLPIEVQDILVNAITHVNNYDAEGKKHGLWRSWYKTGQLMSERTYDNDKLHGQLHTWYKNGQLHRENINGVKRRWNEDGELVEVEEQ